MPQLLFPGNPLAIGVEVGLVIIVTSPDVIGTYNLLGLGPNLSRAILGGVIFGAYSYYIKKSNETSMYNIRKQPPVANFSNTNNSEIDQAIMENYNSERPDSNSFY